MAPIAIDLDHDGSLSFLSRDAGVAFDYGDGNVATAWVDSNDGLLVFDYNQDGLITEGKELVFTLWDPTAQTDLEALSNYFDSNSDGALNSQDDLFDALGVWQDLNSNAITDPGELASLADRGIEALDLTYVPESEPSVQADGDVLVHGEAAVDYTDGSQGLLADAEFAVDPQQTADEPAAQSQEAPEQQEAASLDQPPAAPQGEPAAEEDASVADLVDAYLHPEADPASSSADQQPDPADVSTASVDDLVNQFIEEHPVSDESLAELALDVQDSTDDDPGSHLELDPALSSESVIGVGDDSGTADDSDLTDQLSEQDLLAPVDDVSVVQPSADEYDSYVDPGG